MQSSLEEDGSAKLGHFQATMQAIEVACSAIQMHVNPAEAEATILSLSRSPQPYQACRFILENSQVATARFQAAGAIRDAAVREWTFLSEDVKRSLISFCLCYSMQHGSSHEGYVQVKVASVAAQLLKRGWLEFTALDKEALFYQVREAVRGVHGVDVQFCGINFLEHLISEFSPSTSSAMGLPKEIHQQCQRSIELDYLKIFYSLAQDAAVSVSNRIIESQSEVLEVKVCNAALRLMLQILNWDFETKNRASRTSVNIFSAEKRNDGDLAKRSECTLVQPGREWGDVLISSGHIGWILSLYAALRQKFSCEGYGPDCPIAISARKLIIQLCSLTGTIFLAGHAATHATTRFDGMRFNTTDGWRCLSVGLFSYFFQYHDTRNLHEYHLHQLLSGIIHWIDPSDTICKAIQCGKSESELVDGCRALLYIANVTTPLVFDGLLKSIRPFGTLTLLSTLMGDVVKILMASNIDEETWSWEARDIVLDTWTTLLMQMDKTGRNIPLTSEGMDAAANLFLLIVQYELKVASASALDSDTESDFLQVSTSAMDERLSSYALIARAAITITVPFLARMFSERLSQLSQGSDLINQTRILEEIYSLLLIIGHVLADEVKGETPLVPTVIQTQFSNVEPDNHPVVHISSLIIRFAERSLDPQWRASVFSPRIMEAVVWFLSRWVSSFLMLPEDIVSSNSSCSQESNCNISVLQSRRGLLSFFSEHNQGRPVLDVIVRISMTTLSSYPGERDLQELTCYHLLGALVRQKHICIHLVALDSWHDLAHNFINEKALFLIKMSHQRYLAQALVQSALGLRNAEESNQYVRHIMGNAAMYLAEMTGKLDLKFFAQQPDIILTVCSLFERLRGASCASEPRIQRAVYDIGFSVMNPILILLEIYRHESAVVYMLLKFVVEWVNGQITYLEARETSTVVDFCMQLLQLYSSHNIGKISLSLSSNLLNEAETEKYKDLRALLQLLSNLCSKDLVDFSSGDDGTEGVEISEVVYFGLHIITPLISLDLLKYPKLCYDYFSLLCHLLEVYPETLAKLQGEGFSHVLGTINFGLHNQDMEVVDMCLRALKALSSYHYKEIATGKPGLGSKAVSSKDGGNFQEGIFSWFLRSLMQFLLFDNYSPDLMGNAADALLPLILCEQSLYQNLANELISKQSNPEFRQRLANAFHSLTNANHLTSSLDRPNYQRFRKNLRHFLIEVRGFLQIV